MNNPLWTEYVRVEDFPVTDKEMIVRDAHEYLNRVMAEIKCDLAEMNIYSRAARLLAEQLERGVK